MKTLSQILEALPLSGYKPAKPAAPKKPARPAPVGRVRAQVMTPKGRLATVKKRKWMNKPGYALMKQLPIKSTHPTHPKRQDRRDRVAKPAMKPVSYGKTIKEMKATRFEVKEKRELWSDPGVYPSGAGGSPLRSHWDYWLEGFIEVTLDPKDLAKYADEEEDAVHDFASKEIKDELGREAADNANLKVTRLAPNRFRVAVDSDNYSREDEAVKNLGQLLEEVSND